MSSKGTEERRLAELERQFAELERMLRQVEAQPAAQNQLRHGRALGILTEELSAGGSALAQVWYHNGTEWIQAAMDPVEVYEWGLPDATSLPADSKVGLFMLPDSKWYAFSPTCPGSA